MISEPSLVGRSSPVFSFLFFFPFLFSDPLLTINASDTVKLSLSFFSTSSQPYIRYSHTRILQFSIKRKIPFLPLQWILVRTSQDPRPPACPRVPRRCPPLQSLACLCRSTPPCSLSIRSLNPRPCPRCSRIPVNRRPLILI